MGGGFFLKSINFFTLRVRGLLDADISNDTLYYEHSPFNPRHGSAKFIQYKLLNYSSLSHKIKQTINSLWLKQQTPSISYHLITVITQQEFERHKMLINIIKSTYRVNEYFSLNTLYLISGAILKQVRTSHYTIVEAGLTNIGVHAIEHFLDRILCLLLSYNFWDKLLNVLQAE